MAACMAGPPDASWPRVAAWAAPATSLIKRFMRIFYHPAERLAEIEDRRDVLGVVGYGAAGPARPWCGRAPYVGLPLEPHGPRVCEVIAAGTTQSGARHGVRYAHDGEWLFAATEAPASGAIEAAAVEVYGRLLQVAKEEGYGCLIRAWQYFPDIHGAEEGLERYRQFNRGRHRALGDYLAQGGLRPAATCIGTRAGHLTVYILARRVPGVAIENPRQISAYRYPETYGPRPPDFVRAMKVVGEGCAWLWISGTAAIVGHESRAAGDMAAQMRETFANLDAVVASAGLGEDRRVSLAKIYVRGTDTLPALPGSWAGAPVVVLAGDICRAELLIEIEAVVTAGVQGRGAPR